MKIEVIRIAGKNCITLEDGQKVYDLAFPRVAANESVELDFTGVQVFASPFFNAAVGRLLKDFSADQLNRLLKVANLVPAGMDVLRRVIENARHYYADAATRKAVDDILTERMEDTDLGR